MTATPSQQGKVFLVGGGPGDPGLITLRGYQCLTRADSVLYDYLVNPRLLAHARESVELVCLGRHGHGPLMPQEEINRQLVARARQGQQVVRLKGGDPAVFAHVAEEIEALEAAGVAYEIVPGITAALAASSYASVPVTHGDVASAVALVTGQEREGKQTSLDFDALAKFPGTLVFYMGVTTASHWTTALILAGKPPDTPATIVYRCSWPDQETIACTLSTVADEIERRKMRPPAIVVLGKVAAQVNPTTWFSVRPLHGVRVLVTRAPRQADALYSELAELGANVLVQPAIEISPPADWKPVDQALSRLERYDWLVFSSANGVRYLLDRLLQQGHDVLALGRVKLAAIGEGTAEELQRYHLRPDLVPPEYRAESLAEALSPHAAGKRFLLARASRGRELLAEQLQTAGADVEQVVVYTSTDVVVPDEQVVEALSAGKIDWITVTSSAIGRSLAAMFGQDLRQSKLASISPVTSATLRELGYQPTVEASTYTMSALVQAIRGWQPPKE